MVFHAAVPFIYNDISKHGNYYHVYCSQVTLYKLSSSKCQNEKTTQEIITYSKRQFQSFDGRYRFAIARLIRSKIETKHRDIWDVKEWMGYEKIDTTEDYVKFAKHYYRNAPYDWVDAGLKKIRPRLNSSSFKKGR